MNTEKLKEIVIIVLNLIPFIYLGIVYGSIPEQLPMQWGLDGEVSRMGEKRELWILPILLCGLIYILLKYLPQIDPKQQIEKMGNKLPQVRLWLTIFMSTLATGFIYTSTLQIHQITEPTWIFSVIGLMYIVLGNYMPSMKPNYFVGIRTPWTLENEKVWRKTHQLGGWSFMLCGLIIVVCGLLFDSYISSITLLIVTLGYAIGISIYSYRLHLQLKES